jgi:hypothetical protein
MELLRDEVMGTRDSGRATMATREAFFECIFSPDGNEYRFHVRAWNAKEAEETIKTSLRDNGVREAGTLLIRDRRGSELLRSGYAYEAA